MSIEKILSITGKPGLYELKAQTRGGFVAESLVDGKKISVGARHNVSLLSEIAVYTLTEEVPLREVFQKIKEKENSGKAISHKEPKIKLEEYFFEIMPDYDEDRVYAGDIKKILQWYNILQEKGRLDFSKSETEEKETEKTENPKKEESKGTAVKAPAKEAAPKASSAKKGATGKNTSARKK